MTDTELDGIEAKAKAATPGPWILGASLLIYGPKHPLSKHPDGRIFLARVSGGRNRDDAYFADDGPSITGDGHADAAFIAAANPTTILELIAELRQVRKERDWLAKKISIIAKEFNYHMPIEKLSSSRAPFYNVSPEFWLSASMEAACQEKN